MIHQNSKSIFLIALVTHYLHPMMAVKHLLRWKAFCMHHHIVHVHVRFWRKLHAMLKNTSGNHIMGNICVSWNPAKRWNRQTIPMHMKSIFLLAVLFCKRICTVWKSYFSCELSSLTDMNALASLQLHVSERECNWKRETRNTAVQNRFYNGLIWYCSARNNSWFLTIAPFMLLSAICFTIKSNTANNYVINSGSHQLAMDICSMEAWCKQSAGWTSFWTFINNNFSSTLTKSAFPSCLDI